ncbi:MAG: SpaH/EbpB family LPXTG-anchored major pilin [Clostridia bacterium]|nr:SpaH/EbpB family LPXTG-anchored major pilin [Clostridia bacterium]
MKKTLIRTLALALAVLLPLLAIISVGITVLAAGPNSLTIHKFLVQDRYNPEFLNGTGEELTTDPSGVVRLPGIEFQVFRCYTAAEILAAGGALDGCTTPVTLYTPQDTLDDVAVDYFYNASNPMGESPDYSYWTDANGEIYIDLGTEEGAYYVKEVDNSDPRIEVPADPFLILVPMPHPDGLTWINDVHVYPKNQSPISEFTKSISVIGRDADSYNVGEIIPWFITWEIDVDLDDNLLITDTLSPALTLVPGSIEIFVKDGVSAGTDRVLTVDVDYEVTESPSFSIDFTSAGLAKLKEHYTETMVVTFKTTLGRPAPVIVAGEGEGEADEIGIVNSIVNTASIEYDLIFKSDTATVLFAAIGIYKTDNDANPLAGAQFKIASSKANAEAGNFLKLFQGKIVDVGDANYESEFATELPPVTTDDEGYAMIQGLKLNMGSNTQTYYLMETVAPEGYNKLKNAIEVTARRAGNVSFETETLEYINLSDLAEVINVKGFTLPVTGGAGVVMFSIIGLVLMGGAVLLLVVNSKKKKAAVNS